MTTAEAAAAAAQAGAETAPGGSGCGSCDFCEAARALVYCRADVARLCLACDRRVHAANAVSSRHPRSLLCDACLSSPASILFCSPHGQSQLLCSNCDFDALHGRADGNRAGERRPVEPYAGCPSAVDMLSLLGVSLETEKSLLLDGGGSDWWLDGGGGAGAGEGFSLLLVEEGWVWETPPILSMEDIVVPSNPCHGFHAMGVPPPPKDRNAACGKHKDEILRQLREMMKSDVYVSNDLGLLEADVGFQPRQELQLRNIVSNDENGVASVVVPCPLNAELENKDSGPSTFDFVNSSKPKVPHKDCCDIDGVPAVCSEHQLEMSMEESKVFLDRPVDAHGSVSDAGSWHLMPRDDLPLLPPRCGHKLLGLDRVTVLSRYKEKRKMRRFDKQIRYESRKVRADGRMRIKGRFAKVKRHAES